MLADLTREDGALHAVVSDEAVDKRLVFLSVAIYPTHSLRVVTRVPRDVKDDDATCRHKTDAK